MKTTLSNYSCFDVVFGCAVGVVIGVCVGAVLGAETAGAVGVNGCCVGCSVLMALPDAPSRFVFVAGSAGATLTTKASLEACSVPNIRSGFFGAMALISTGGFDSLVFSVLIFLNYSALKIRFSGREASI